MPFGKTEEEKARRKAEKDAAREVSRQQAEEAKQREAAARAREAYLKTPVGQADQALERGDMFSSFMRGSHCFRVGRPTGHMVQRPRRRHSGRQTRSARSRSLAGGLSIFASVFVETETNSRDKVLSGGAVTRTSGYVEGVYLFRRTSTLVNGPIEGSPAE
jgi:hypothetical protein